MKTSEVEIGGKYTARVSGRLTTVEVLSKYEPKGYWPRFIARNLTSGREIRLTAAKLRKRQETCRWFGTIAECRDNLCRHWTEMPID